MIHQQLKSYTPYFIGFFSLLFVVLIIIVIVENNKKIKHSPLSSTPKHSHFSHSIPKHSHLPRSIPKHHSKVVSNKKYPSFNEFCPPLDPSKPQDYENNIIIKGNVNNKCQALMRLTNPYCVYAQDYLVNGYGGLQTAVGTNAGLGPNTFCN
tara:strand:+ start:423 stop:878 length:456 start_codon:yes stop_codon:yes gene_type:complete